MKLKIKAVLTPANNLQLETIMDDIIEALCMDNRVDYKLAQSMGISAKDLNAIVHGNESKSMLRKRLQKYPPTMLEDIGNSFK